MSELLDALASAIDDSDKCPWEHQGGVILRRIGNEKDFKYAAIPNLHRGTARAKQVYEPQENCYRYIEKRESALAWRVFASYSGHPKGAGKALPTIIELNTVFKLHKVNYIYSKDFNLMFCFNWQRVPDGVVLTKSFVEVFEPATTGDKWGTYGSAG